jgi:hypothetical protein
MVYAQTDEEDNSEVRFQDLGFGMSVGVYMYQGDLQGSTSFYHATPIMQAGMNALVRYKLGYIGDFSTLLLEGRLGYHSIKANAYYNLPGAPRHDYEFTNHMIKVSADLLWEFLPVSRIRPYVMLGVGAIAQNPKATMSNLQPGDNFTEMINPGSSAIAIPAGIGITCTVSEKVDLHFDIEKVLTFSDWLDGWKSGLNDGYVGFAVGALVYF